MTFAASPRRAAAAGWLLLLAGLGLATAVVAANALRFVDAKPQVRTKDFRFFPSPVAARMLSMGQASTAAKLRWIDSFQYFQLQLDRRNDTIVGGEGGRGFQRLYSTLIELDPKFKPFYLHGITATSGVIADHQSALAFAQRGLIEYPHDFELWMNVMAIIASPPYEGEAKLPTELQGLLEAWYEAAPPEEKHYAREWLASWQRRKTPGLEQLPMWEIQYAGLGPGAAKDVIAGIIREQLAMWWTRELQLLRQDLAKAGRAKDADDQTVWAQELAKRIPRGLPPYARVLDADGRLRSDPFGMPWIVANGLVVSEGVDRYRFERSLEVINEGIVKTATANGHWPASLDEITDARLRPFPRDAVVKWVAPRVEVTWPGALSPWPLLGDAGASSAKAAPVPAAPLPAVPIPSSPPSARP